MQRELAVQLLCRRLRPDYCRVSKSFKHWNTYYRKYYLEYWSFADYMTVTQDLRSP